MTENPAESRTLDGYTYTTKPVVAEFGPHRFAFPANYYDDQIGPAIGGGVGLTLMWPGLQAAPPGTRPTRSMADHYRAISVSIDYVDKVPISKLLQRMASTEATTEEGAIERTDPRRRLDLRSPGTPQFGLVPYAIDEKRMEAYAQAYSKKRGEAPARNPRTEKEWYVARSRDDELTTFIRCDQPLDGLNGLVIEGELLVPDAAPMVASCTHDLVDIPDSLSMTIRYPRVLLKDWKAIEDAARATLGRYRIR
ncbi:hypothetical protein M2410_001863 [Stenotrophomonas chelatiphaga]|uniref:hypothetical protein n=1 Tax=Stenotrophomonas chelatiphaga TaxID=517011 RepID=UPI0021687129|nr:hypothetical protein [Stenotrophomonas chelatiphaga]MCS4231130.1 hypothetical protein [Stenotrophomonas chelatiphaga]